MYAQWNGPHINHTGWLPPVEERGGSEHALTTQTYAAANWKSAAGERVTHGTHTCLHPHARPSSLSISDSPAPILPPSLTLPPAAGKAASYACMRAIEMGHFLIKYNINYCEHHYRYVRFD